MSAFGLIIKFKKKDETSFSDENKVMIVSKAEEIMEKEEYSSNLEESDYSTVHQWDDKEIFLIFSEYYDEHYEDELYQFIQENDLEEAKEIAEKLKELLGEEFEIEAKLEDW